MPFVLESRISSPANRGAHAKCVPTTASCASVKYAHDVLTTERRELHFAHTPPGEYIAGSPAIHWKTNPVVPIPHHSMRRESSLLTHPSIPSRVIRRPIIRSRRWRPGLQFQWPAPVRPHLRTGPPTAPNRRTLPVPRQSVVSMAGLAGREKPYDYA